MFYLGGLTLGYLSPHSPAVAMTAAVNLSQKKTPSQKTLRAATGGDDKQESDSSERPILWPWHLFC